MSTELIVILAGAGLVVLVWLLMRFGKLIATWALIFGGLTAVIVFGLALLFQASASREAARAAPVASAGQSITTLVGGLVIGGLSVTLLGALGVIGYLVIKLRLVERGRLLPPKRKRRRLPHKTTPDYEPVVYILEGEPDDIGVTEWTSGDWPF